MAKTITIKLHTPLDGHGGKIAEVTFREPTARDFFELGEPRTAVFTQPKSADQPVEVRQVENGPVIQKYLERCVMAPADGLLVFQCALPDAMRIKERFLADFFDAALALAAASEQQSGSSSST